MIETFTTRLETPGLLDLLTRAVSISPTSGGGDIEYDEIPEGYDAPPFVVRSFKFSYVPSRKRTWFDVLKRETRVTFDDPTISGSFFADKLHAVTDTVSPLQEIQVSADLKPYTHPLDTSTHLLTNIRMSFIPAQVPSLITSVFCIAGVDPRVIDSIGIGHGLNAYTLKLDGCGYEGNIRDSSTRLSQARIRDIYTDAGLVITALVKPAIKLGFGL